MNIIILNNRKGHSKTLHLPVWLPWALALMFVFLPVAAGVGAYYAAYHLDSPLFSDDVAERWHQDVSTHRNELAQLNEQSQREHPQTSPRGTDGKEIRTGGDVPGESNAKSAEEFRRRVLEGLSKSKDGRLAPAVRRYAEGLLR